MEIHSPYADIEKFTYTFHKGGAVLLSAFIKKSQKTPKKELHLARTRKKLVEKE